MKPMGGRTWKYWPASGPVFFEMKQRGSWKSPSCSISPRIKLFDEIPFLVSIRLLSQNSVNKAISPSVLSLKTVTLTEACCDSCFW